jgi:GNAT superfamily N-acetyltransferase
MGIGQRLLDWGIERAHANNIPVQTEASPKGLGLYLKNGFEQIGRWNVDVPGIEGGVEMPVMRLETANAGE